MIRSFIIAGIIYLGILFLLSRYTRLRQKTTSNYLLAGSNVGLVLGLFTTASTLFSAFTMIGMPDFFRVHGVGAWIFLAVSDTMMVYGLIRLGNMVRRKARMWDYKGMAGLMIHSYGSRFAGYVAFAGALLFLIPYISVQISGISIFLSAAFPGSMPVWGWSCLIVGIMILYSETGGLKAIMYNDTLQGIILFIVIWIIGWTCLSHFGSVSMMFEKVESMKVELLSVPGPNGLFTPQFLIISAVSIIMLPFTQPQISTRIIIMKNANALKRMGIGLGIFAILVILPTVFMGMYGAVNYPEETTQEFIGHVLLYDQASGIAALGLIGLIAAAISTSDSQIFALGAELRSVLVLDEKKALAITRVSIALFGLIALIFSISSSEHLVLLARTSFSGTALMGPMILLGILGKRRSGNLLPLATAITLLIFILYKSDVFTFKLWILEIETVLFLFLILITILEIFRKRTKLNSTNTSHNKNKMP